MGKRALNFALTGGGFISDRHLSAIDKIGGKLLMVCDTDEKKHNKFDSNVEFYTKLENMAEREKFKLIDWVIICTPNYTHAPIIEWALRQGKNVLCEKPTVISIDELDRIKNLERSTGKKVFTCLQLRFSKKLQKLRRKIQESPKIHDVKLDLNMHRDTFYWDGWKGKEEESGGLLYNIGVHYFDLLLWLFGDYEVSLVQELDVKKGNGTLQLEKASVVWRINLEAEKDNQYRNISIDGKRMNLTRILESLHDDVYKGLLTQRGVSLVDVRPVIQLCEKLSS